MNHPKGDSTTSGINIPDDQIDEYLDYDAIENIVDAIQHVNDLIDDLDPVSYAFFEREIVDILTNSKGSSDDQCCEGEI